MTDVLADTQTAVQAGVTVRLGEVGRVRRAIRGSATVDELFARAAHAVCAECGFDRGVVVTVEEGVLSASDSGTIEGTRSDRLRRALLAQPVSLAQGTEEHATIRRADGPASSRRRRASDLADALGLVSFVYAAVAPEARTLALLVVDRAEPPVAPSEAATVGMIAAFLALELSRIVQRARVDELAAEVRQFSVTALALARQSREAPVALPRDHGLGLTFPMMDVAAVPTGERASALFSARELRVASLLAEGRSNRAIAEVLTISPETVKTHVARILRKLGAANRAEAVSRYLRLAETE